MTNNDRYNPPQKQKKKQNKTKKKNRKIEQHEPHENSG